MQLHSAYLGHPDAEQTSAANLVIAPGERPQLWTIEHDLRELPLAHTRQRCLLDHLAIPAEQIRETTPTEVQLDVPTQALAPGPP